MQRMVNKYSVYHFSLSLSCGDTAWRGEGGGGVGGGGCAVLVGWGSHLELTDA